jgi:hypothetical protein
MSETFTEMEQIEKMFKEKLSEINKPYEKNLEDHKLKIDKDFAEIKEMVSSLKEDANAVSHKKDLTEKDIIAVQKHAFHKYATEFCEKITDVKGKHSLGSYIKARLEADIPTDKHLAQAIKYSGNTSIEKNKITLSINPLEYELSPAFQLTPLEIKSSSYAEIFQDIPLVEIGANVETIELPAETQTINAAIVPFEGRDRISQHLKNTGKFKKNTIVASGIVNGFEYSESLMRAGSSYYAGFIMRQMQKVAMANLEIFASGLFDGVYGKAFDMNVDVEASSKFQHMLPIRPKLSADGKAFATTNGSYVYEITGTDIGSIDLLAKRDALKPLIKNNSDKFYVNSGATGTITGENLVKLCTLAPMALGETKDTVKIYINPTTLESIKKILQVYGQNNFNDSFFNYSEVRGTYKICGIEVRTSPEMPPMETGKPAILIANLRAYFSPYKFYSVLKEGNPGNPDFDTLRGIAKLDVFGSAITDPSKAISVIIG